MSSWKSLCCCVSTVAVVLMLSNAASAAVINEYWADDAFGDDVEFAELFGASGESLSGLSFLIVDGDTGGDTTSGNFLEVNLQVDFTSETIPSDGYLVIGNDAAPNVDIVVTGGFENGSQTYALVQTADIEYDAVNTENLTEASNTNITANLIDALGTVDGGAGDHVYFGAPGIGPNPAGFAWDTASRFPNGMDTDSASDWATQDNFGLDIEQGDVNDLLSTPGVENVPEPSSVSLLCLLGLLMVRRR